MFAALAALTLLGLGLRLVYFDQALFGDELSTLYHVKRNGLGGTIDAVSSTAEITPPLYFVLAWLSTQLGPAVLLVRLPALLAGVATIPLVYLVGARAVGSRAGLLAAALMAISPGMAFYAADGRAYTLMLALLLGSTLALLIAAEDGRRRWWALYAALSALAMYSHYTAAFPLAAQLLWLLWAHPAARRPALLANLGAVVLYLPWISGLRGDLDSPTRAVLELIQPDGLEAKLKEIALWAFGNQLVPVERLPGRAAVVVAAVAIAVALVAALIAWRRPRPDRTEGPVAPRAGVVLAFALALAAPLAELLLLLLGSDMLGARNMIASWPGFALAVAASLVAAGPRLGVACAVAVFGCFAIGAAKGLDGDSRTPDFEGAAEAIEAAGEPGDPVLDMSAIPGSTPVPLTPLAAQLPGALFPQLRPFLSRGRPPFIFGTSTPPPGAAAARDAFGAAAAGRLFVLAFAAEGDRVLRAGDRLRGLDVGSETSRPFAVPPGTTIVSERRFQGVHPLVLYELRLPGARAG